MITEVTAGCAIGNATASWGQRAPDFGRKLDELLHGLQLDKVLGERRVETLRRQRGTANRKIDGFA
jgi:hypothetical protein